MTRNKILVLLLIYVVGGFACANWAVSIQNESSLWSASGLLGLVLWSSFFGIANAIGWMTYWSREHWMG
jgi:hypothetical protein